MEEGRGVGGLERLKITRHAEVERSSLSIKSNKSSGGEGGTRVE
jgi:hypothetical protein